MRVPKEWAKILVKNGLITTEQAEELKGGVTMWFHMTKDVPGMNAAPRSFYLSLDQCLRDFDSDGIRCTRSMSDPSMYILYRHDKDGTFKGTVGTILTHVDDLRARAKPQLLDTLNAHLERRFGEGSYDRWKEGAPSHKVEYRGIWLECTETGMYWDQCPYIEKKVKPLTTLPGRKELRSKRHLPATDEMKEEFQSKKGVLQWVKICRGTEAFRVSRHSSALPTLTYGDCEQLDNTIRYVLQTQDKRRWYPKLKGPLKTISYCDASYGNLPDGKSQGGHIVTYEGAEPGKANVVELTSTKIKRVAPSVFDAETLQGLACVDATIAANMLLRELEHGPEPGLLERAARRSVTPGLPEAIPDMPHSEIWTDSMSFVDSVYSTKEPACRRRRADIGAVREALALGDVNTLEHIFRDSNPADPLTKEMGPDTVTRAVLDRLYW